MKILAIAAIGLTLGLSDLAAAEPVAGQAGQVFADLALDIAQVEVGAFIEVPFTLTDASGLPLTAASVTVSGGMAMHGHGLPTSPVVEDLGEGRYVIKGLKFSMGGDWQLRLTVTSGTVIDAVDFTFAL